MANQKEIKRRIRSVEKTQQITSAMRMVSAAKLRRAQDAIIAARPYSQQLWATMYELGRRHEGGLRHPLLQEHPERRRLEVVVIASDRGLCGAFNANVLKAAQETIAQRGSQFEETVVSTVGRKAGDFFRRRRPIEKSWVIGQGVDMGLVTDIGQHLASRYQAGEVDEVMLVGSEFVSALTQRPVPARLLPLVPEFSGLRTYEEEAGREPFEIEPSPTALLDVLVPQALEFSIYRYLLESQAGEHAARMTAMESATRNTEELIGSLTLQFNRARQAAITKELMEIVSGAEALK
jgi:F-type H+-transporting ATPase subunit gamma